MDSSDDIVQNIKIEVEDGNFSSAFDQLKSAAKEAFDSIKEAFNGGDIDFDKVREAGAKAFGEFKEAGTKAFEALKGAGSSAAEHLKTIFENLKSAGSTAFDAIKGAGSGVASELKTAFEGLGVSLNTVLLGIGGAFAAITVGIGFAVKAAINFTKSQNEITNALGELSEKTHTAISDVDALEKAYAHGGVSAKEFASGYSHLSDVVEKTWDKIKKDTESGVDTLEAKSIAAARAANALNKIESERKQTPLENPDLGKPIDPFKGDLVTAEETQKAITKELELRQARLASREAERAENEARRNDLSQITKGVQGLIDGNQDALKGFNATAENIVKGVVAAAGKGAETLDKMGEAFASVGSKAPEVKDVLATLASTLGKIEDPALRSRVALTALGSSGQAFLSALDSGNVEKFTANIDKMRGSVTETDKKIAGELKNALAGLNADLSTIGTSIASAFGPGFTEAVKKFDEFLSRRSEVKGFSETIASGLGAALSAATGGFVTLAETISGTFDALSRFSKLIVDFSKGTSFKTRKEDAIALYDTIKAIDDLTSKDENQRKQGRETLLELNKKDAEVEKQRADEEARKQQDNKTKKKTPEELVSGPIDFSSPSDVATKSASGLHTELSHIVEGWGHIIEGWGIIFDKLKSTQEKAAGGEGTNPFLKETNRTGLEPTTTAPPEGQQSSTPIDAIKNSLQPLIDTINSLGTKKNEPITDPAHLGIRGDAADEAAQANKQMADASKATVDPLAELKAGALAAAEALKSVQANNDNNNNDNTDNTDAVAVADGGHIRGPGTSTSDSIPAMLSDGEYVVKKSAVDKIGIAALDAINAGRAHFAEGGPAQTRRRLPNGDLEVVENGITTVYDKDGNEKGIDPNGREIKPRDLTPKDSSGDVVGKAVDTAKQADSNYDKRNSGDSSADSTGEPDHYDSYVGGHVDQAVLDSLNEASQAAGDADPNFIPIIYHQGSGGGSSTKRKRHAEGGLIGDIANALNNIRLPKFADGGMVSMAPHLPRFADGGMVSIAPRLPRFADGGAVGYQDSSGSDMQHLGTVDLRTDHGPVRVAVDGGGLSQLRKAAVQRNIGSTPKSSWVK